MWLEQDIPWTEFTKFLWLFSKIFRGLSDSFLHYEMVTIFELLISQVFLLSKCLH